MTKPRIIIVDDERDMRDFLEIMLRKEGYEAFSFPTPVAALGYCKENRCDLVLTDLKMPGMTGLEFLKAVKELDPATLVIMITAYASVDTAVEAMKAGAFDYFTKPFNVDEIRLNIRKALKLRNLEVENKLLKDDIKTRFGFANMVGVSSAMTEVYQLIVSIAKSKTNVFITGESGTGKEVAARAICYESDRKDAPFVAINCGAIPENLLESELFGHQKGAFTGAVCNKEGLVEQADGGTLFLDELTEMPLHLQVKLLRFIQERQFRRVGGTTDISVDIRLIAASNRNLEAEVKAGRFREDLFYRLNVIRIDMPALRERKEDIPLLTRHFLDKYNKEIGKSISGISDAAMAALMDYAYPGNVRELENIIERAVALEPSGLIAIESLPAHVRVAAKAASRVTADTIPRQELAAANLKLGAGFDLEKTVEEFERAAILEAVKTAGGVKKKAAELLGMSFRSLRYKLSKYGIGGD